MQKNKYYVVWSGTQPGVYASWEDCEKQVKGVAGAKYKGFPTRAEADAAFAQPAPEYPKRAAQEPRAKTQDLRLKTLDLRLKDCLCVDAACSGNPGKMEYRGVLVNESGVTEIFHRGIFEDATNNIGEFLAIVHGLAHLKKEGSQLPIYSDSRTAQAWVRNKQAKTKLERTEKNAVLFDLIRRAEHWLQNNTYITKIMKWDTEHWGEIPADFGRK